MRVLEVRDCQSDIFLECAERAECFEARVVVDVVWNYVNQILRSPLIALCSYTQMAL